MGPRCGEAAGNPEAGWRAGRGADSALCYRWRAMAASPVPGGGGAGAVHSSNASGFAFDSGLEIRTRSVEQTLLPLVSQVPRPPVPVCAARDGGGRSFLGSGMAGREAALSRIARARRRHGGTRVGAQSRAATPGLAVKRWSPAGALFGLGSRTRLAQWLRVRPSRGSVGPLRGPLTSRAKLAAAAQSAAAVAVRIPGQTQALGADYGIPVCLLLQACSPRPLSCSLGHVWARPTPTHSGHLSCLSLSFACPPPLSARTL